MQFFARKGVGYVSFQSVLMVCVVYAGFCVCCVHLSIFIGARMFTQSVLMLCDVCRFLCFCVYYMSIFTGAASFY